MDATRESLFGAIEQFDRELRDTPEWKNWQENKTHKFAIDLGARLYPLKKIVSLATGVPVSRFSGGIGSGQANAVVERVGLSVVSLRSTNPDWTRDELIVALDAYLTFRPQIPGVRSREIVELSETLSKLGEKLFSRDEPFRQV